MVIFVSPLFFFNFMKLQRQFLFVVNCLLLLLLGIRATRSGFLNLQSPNNINNQADEYDSNQIEDSDLTEDRQFLPYNYDGVDGYGRPQPSYYPSPSQGQFSNFDQIRGGSYGSPWSGPIYPPMMASGYPGQTVQNKPNFAQNIYPGNSNIQEGAMSLFGPKCGTRNPYPEQGPKNARQTRSIEKVHSNNATNSSKIDENKKLGENETTSTSSLKLLEDVDNNVTQLDGGDRDQNDASFDRVVGGRPVQVSAWPWQVSIRHHGIHTCGGAILSRRFILTAAHCFDGDNGKSQSIIDIDAWTVYAAKSKVGLGEPGQVGPLEMEAIHIHPNYDVVKKYDSDLALIHLKKPLKYSNKVYPICLPKQGSIPARDSNCFVTGFGETKGTGGQRRLKEARLPLIDSSDCGTATRYFHLTNNMLCAGYLQGGISSCQGDSGGPLSCQIRNGPNDVFVLQGVVSFGYKCAGRNQPSVYVRVANFVDWIKLAASRSNCNYRQKIAMATTTMAPPIRIGDYGEMRPAIISEKDDDVSKILRMPLTTVQPSKNPCNK